MASTRRAFLGYTALAGATVFASVPAYVVFATLAFSLSLQQHPNSPNTVSLVFASIATVLSTNEKMLINWCLEPMYRNPLCK